MGLTPLQTTGYLDRIERKPLPTFALSDMENFPFEEFQSRLSLYTEMEQWYSGEALNETIQQQDKDVELYPVRVNPLKGAVEKHTHFLFGQVTVDDHPLVNPRIVPAEDSDGGRSQAEEVESVLTQVWFENQGRATQWENGAASQVYGGCIWHVVYDPFDPLLTIPIRVETIHPKYFVGVPYAGNMWKLREAWIVQPISAVDAALYGVSVDYDEECWLIQHYTETDYEVTVNGIPATRMVNGQVEQISGPNVWGFVPVVYIPHIRVLEFYGENIIDVAKGIVKEINLRIADYGDAVTVDAHAYLGMRNVQGAPTIQNLAPGVFAINIGNNPGITGQDADPDLFELRKQMASSPMKDLVDLLYSMYRRLVNVPAVVDGEDEGSQRSGLTLAMRMISLTSHTEAERIFWTTGLTLVNRMILRMLAVKQEVGITIEKAALRMKMEWAPILPRDREMIVTEAVSLMSAKLGSPERLLEMLGVDNIPAERDLIMKFWEEVTSMEAEAAAAQFGNQPGGGGKPSAAPKEKGLSGSSTAAQKATKE